MSSKLSIILNDLNVIPKNKQKIKKNQVKWLPSRTSIIGSSIIGTSIELLL